MEIPSLPFPKEGSESSHHKLLSNLLCHIWTDATSNEDPSRISSWARDQPYTQPSADWFTHDRASYEDCSCFLWLQQIRGGWFAPSQDTLHPVSAILCHWKVTTWASSSKEQGKCLFMSRTETHNDLNKTVLWCMLSPCPQLQKLPFFHLTRLCTDRRMRSCVLGSWGRKAGQYRRPVVQTWL